MYLLDFNIIFWLSVISMFYLNCYGVILCFVHFVIITCVCVCVCSYHVFLIDLLHYLSFLFA